MLLMQGYANKCFVVVVRLKKGDAQPYTHLESAAEGVLYQEEWSNLSSTECQKGQDRTFSSPSYNGGGSGPPVCMIPAPLSFHPLEHATSL